MRFGDGMLTVGCAGLLLAGCGAFPGGVGSANPNATASAHTNSDGGIDNNAGAGGQGPSSDGNTLDANNKTAGSGHLAVKNGQLVDPNGAPLALHGVNWFGFDNGSTMVDGTYQASNYPLGGDFATVVQRMMLLGFNTVRLPFSFVDLAATPKSISSSCAIPSQQDIAASVTPPGQTAPASPPNLAMQPTRKAGQCNDYVPSTSTQDRLVWVANFFAHNGFYVVVDNHFRSDTTATQNTSQWLQKWASLAAQLNKDPVTANHLLIDVLNEPDNFGVKWAASGSTPGLGDLYLSAMDAITAVAPQQVFLLEGTGQGGLQANWGDGFCTDSNVIAAKGLSDPTPFFSALRAKAYARQVMISPHVYGPAVTTNDNASSGAGLFDRLSTSFGYLTTQGFCQGGACDVFPVVIGEFGSKLTDTRDVATMNDLVSYLNNSGAANDGRHAKIGNWIYWDWNPNSGDTGGLVDDNWNAIQWNKITLLQGLGLTHR